MNRRNDTFIGFLSEQEQEKKGERKKDVWRRRLKFAKRKNKLRKRNQNIRKEIILIEK